IYTIIRSKKKWLTGLPGIVQAIRYFSAIAALRQMKRPSNSPAKRQAKTKSFPSNSHFTGGHLDQWRLPDRKKFTPGLALYLRGSAMFHLMISMRLNGLWMAKRLPL